MREAASPGANRDGRREQKAETCSYDKLDEPAQDKRLARSLDGRLRMLKKILTWGGLAFLVFFIAYRPGEAGDVVGTIAGAIGDVGNGFASFITGLVT